MNAKPKPNRRTVRAAIRGSVPDGKLKRAQIVLSSEKYGERNVAGFTQYDERDRKTVVKLGAPDNDGAFGITVRGHETRHAAKHTLRRKKPMTENEAEAAQRVDDVFVETLPLPSLHGDGLDVYRRAHLTMALKDLQYMAQVERGLKSGKIADSAQVRNTRLMAALRVKAMLKHYGDGASTRTVRTARRAHKKLIDIIGVHTNSALQRVIALSKSLRSRNRAISMLVMMMETPERRSEFDEDVIKLPPLTDATILAPPKEGTALEGRMLIHDLRPKSIHTAKERKISVKYSPDGVHLSPSRYVAAIVSGDSHGLFSRRVRQKPGGTVLIDASGSMGVNATNLTQLLKLVPTATVAYYSGKDGRATGTLAIYAHGGLRYSGQLPPETIMGGNAIDLPAVRWLLKQPKPWHLVSDLGFLGGVLGSEYVAHALVERAQRRGDLTVHNSLDAAFESFGGKGDLAGMSPARRARFKRLKELRKARVAEAAKTPEATEADLDEEGDYGL